MIFLNADQFMWCIDFQINEKLNLTIILNNIKYLHYRKIKFHIQTVQSWGDFMSLSMFIK
jgi:hypothetical protein